jgi:uncharacterized protein (DUF2345 family)
MASKTQIRATQVTGSFPTDGESATTEATANVSDLGGILDHLASSIRRIHGNADWSNSAAGVFTAATFDVDTAGAFDVVAGGIASIDAVGTSNLTTRGALTVSGSSALNLASDSGEIDITARQGAIDINATAGAIDVDAGTTLSLDGAGGINIGTAANVAVDFNASTFDLESTSTFSIDGVGTSNVTTRGALTVSGSSGLNLASDSGEIDITARQGAIDVNALLGNITVDATVGDINIEAAAGDITIGATLASSKALNLGRPGSTEITLVPNDVAANEKIAIVNTEGTSDDAIKIDAVAGGLTLAAGNDSLILAADGTDADALKIDSAGGIDIGLAGAFDVESSAGLISIDGVGTSNLTTRGALTLSGSDSLSLASDGGEIDITARQGAIDVNALVGAITIDGASTISIDAGGALNIDTTSGALSVGTATSGIAVNIGHSTSETTVGDNLTVAGDATVTGDLTVNGTTVTINVSDLQVEDKLVELNHPSNGFAGRVSNSGAGLYLSGSTIANDITWLAQADGGRMELSEDSGVATGKSFYVDSNNVLSQTVLGSTVLASSLTSLGTIASLVATTADINNGTVDAIIGGTTPKAGTFTTCDATTDFTIDGLVLTADTITNDDALTVVATALTLDSAAGLVLDADSGIISLKDGGALYGELTRNDAAFFVMSASAELHLGDNRSGVEGMAGGTIGLGATGDYTSFISNFSNTTSIVGALNTLAEGGTREKYQLTITGSGGHAANMALLINAALDHDQGYSTGKTDVFVNGQMMLSGASASDGDYKLHGQTAIGGEAVADMVTFFFALERDDVITVIKM